jgi:hypothetical protein
MVEGVERRGIAMDELLETRIPLALAGAADISPELLRWRDAMTRLLSHSPPLTRQILLTYSS